MEHCPSRYLSENLSLELLFRSRTTLACNSLVTRDRSGPGARFHECKIGVTIDFACDHGARVASPQSGQMRVIPWLLWYPFLLAASHLKCQGCLSYPHAGPSQSMLLLSNSQAQEGQLLLVTDRVVGSIVPARSTTWYLVPDHGSQTLLQRDLSHRPCDS